MLQDWRRFTLDNGPLIGFRTRRRQSHSLPASRGRCVARNPLSRSCPNHSLTTTSERWKYQCAIEIFTIPYRFSSLLYFEPSYESFKPRQFGSQWRSRLDDAARYRQLPAEVTSRCRTWRLSILNTVSLGCTSNQVHPSPNGQTSFYRQYRSRI